MIKGQDGTWYLAIRTRKLTRAEEFIVFLSGRKGGRVAAEVTEKDLLDTTGKGRLLYKEIIFGCVGGVFHAARGDLTVLSLTIHHHHHHTQEVHTVGL